MILYTPLSNEDIFPAENQANLEYVNVNGRTVCVGEQEGKYTVVQLLSTNPQDFMDTSLKPGEEIKMS